jgi:DNA-binding transcriptional MerR regulator
MSMEVKHRSYAVGELAKLSGVSVRTLHHYDSIGLLKPAAVGANGYRHYGREELLRLQQILLHRQIGMSLADIATVLDAPGFDRLAALRLQRERILAEADRQHRLLRTIDRTIAQLEGEQLMQDKSLYDGLEPEKQAAYEAYIIERYGEKARQNVEAGRRRMAEMTPEGRQAHMAELAELEADLSKALDAGIDADDPVLDPLLARHHQWMAVAWASPPSADAYAGLGELYGSHPDFVARFNSISPGLASWLPAAMAAFARRRLS